ncbi:hypothetical protein [Roseburia sp. 1XD42-69]|uniref:hypothetical protein n=1 Tax=Roseburia sp. 1XD42-69 TaxID=2320088 RepID=UPI000EA360CE|nr:hypothetical protein [Roseburia sp. 1XD42-69]RKJ64274.1 hypothetical protein D7Y06_12550 [Roseburia sp. 1XD42-69]
MTFIGTKHIEAYRLIDSEFQEGFSGDCLHFKDEEELEQILYLFKRIIEEKGEKIFSEIRRPLEEILAENERHWKMYREREALNEAYFTGNYFAQAREYICPWREDLWLRMPLEEVCGFRSL